MSGARLGIGLGGTTVTAVVTDDQGSVLGLSEAPTGDHTDPAAVLDRVVAVGAEACEAAGVAIEELGGIGVGLPGEVDPAAGLFRSSPILPTWTDVAVSAALEAGFGLPVAIENDANATLLGEWAFGAGRGADPVLLITLGTGIGGAVLVNGKIVTGHRGSAGEVGHLSVDPNGPACWCGGRGCLGLLASATALVEAYRTHAFMDASVALDGRVVARAFHGGDRAAQLAVDQVARHLANGIAAAAVVIAPERVILFGGILGGLSVPLLAGVRHRLAARPYPAVLASLQVVPATLGPLAGAIGASLLGGAA